MTFALVFDRSLRHGTLRTRMLSNVKLDAGRWRRLSTLSEVLSAAKEGDGSPPEAHPDSFPKKRKELDKGQNGVLWFSNVYPSKVSRFDFRSAFTHHNHETLIPRLLPDGVEILNMVPREREGGVFVWFYAPSSFCEQVRQGLMEKDSSSERHGRSFKPKSFKKKQNEDALDKVISGISQYLKTHSVRAFLCPFPVRAHRVEGDPFLEDLNSRYPGSSLRICFDAQACNIREKDMFVRLRRYGQLADIEPLRDGKGYKATFLYSAGAIAARNCLYGAEVAAGKASVDSAEKVSVDSGASIVFHIEFETYMRKWLQDLIMNNARFAVPLIAFFMIGTTYFIWDPMRTTAVQLRVAGAVRDQWSGVWGKVLQMWGSWSQTNLQTSLSSLSLGFVRVEKTKTSLLRDFWIDRNDELSVLKKWLSEPQDRVMLLTGQRGNGQGALVHHLLDGSEFGHRGAVFIDVSEMLDQSSDDHAFLRRLCRAFGYSPAPLVEKHLSAVLDMLMPGSGKLSRSSESISTVQRVLSCTTQALSSLRLLQTTELSVAPLFVIDGFTAENKDRQSGFFDLLVSWAAYITDANLGRVLFIADSSLPETTMLAALRNRPEKLEVQQLRDAELPAVRAFISRQLGSEIASKLTPADLAVVGGRFRDVAALVAHLKEDETPVEAVRRLVEAATMTIRTLLVYGQSDAVWTRPQLWRAIRLLSTDCGEGVPFDTFLWKVFRGDEAALRSMLQSNLVTVKYENEIPEARLRQRVVHPGSPLYAEVFRRLVRHRGNSAILDLEVAKEDIKREEDKIEEYEVKLVRLQEVDDVLREKGRALPDPNKALLERKEQLLSLIADQRQKLEKYYKAKKDAQVVLNSLKTSKIDLHVAEALATESQPINGERHTSRNVFQWLQRIVIS